MGFIKRAFYSMKYRKGQNIALTIAYTLLFALTLGLLLVYLSMSAKVDHLQKSLGCAVTLRGMSYRTDTKFGNLNPSPDDVATFVNSPYVETYSYVSNPAYVDLEGELFPVVPESKIGLYEYQTKNHSDGYAYTKGYLGDCVMVPVTSSQYYDAFTIYGFEVAEGNHFTQEDRDAVLISTDLAVRNGIKVGDQITFSTGNHSKQVKLENKNDVQYATLTVCGLFNVPNAKEMGYTNEHIAEEPANLVVASFDAAASMCNWQTKDPTISWVTAYLKSPDNMDAFLAETKEKMSIERIVGSQTGYGHGPVLSQAEFAALSDKYDGSPFYTLYLDNEWYEIVAKPLESVRNLMGIFLTVVLAGSAVVLALVVLLSLGGREREFGVLLSLGEPEWKIIGQIFIEVFAPILLAAVLGAVLGIHVVVPLAENYSDSILSTQSREEQTDWQTYVKDQEEDFMKNESWLSLYFGSRNPKTIAVVNSVPYEAGPEVYGAYFALDFGMVVLILLIQMLSVLRVKPARILTGRE